jgi:phage/plasmid-like protein (TIGR03299 family)
MGHGITSTDNAMFRKQRAWHGLGYLVEGDLGPRAALSLIGAEWGVEQLPLIAIGKDGTQRDVSSHRLNVRADNGEVLGLVTSGYQVVSNVDLADFAEQLSTIDQRVVVESAATLFGGKQLFFLLRGESFFLPGDDETRQYCLVSNGHDGQTCLRVTPTNIRVVCANTWRMVLGEAGGREDFSSAGYVARHCGSMQEKLEEARRAIDLFRRGAKTTEEIARALSGREVMSDKELGEFFAAQYSRDFGAIPKNPADKAEQRQRDKAVDAYRSFSRRWDDERRKFGSNSLWIAANAYTGLIQHDRKARGKDDAARVERRIDSNLFGLSADRTAATFESALSLCS